MTAPSSRALGIVALALVPMLACVERGAQPDEAETTAVAEVTATLDTARERPFTETIRATGVVLPRPGHVAVLSAPAATRIARILVAPGDRVTAGALLIELEQQGFVGAVQSSDAALAAAERAVERAQRLVDAGVAPRKDLELATAELAAARLSATNARRQAELSHLRAPLTGAVTRVDAVLGANVDVGQPLIEIADPSALDVVLFVPPRVADQLRVGISVELSDGGGTSTVIASDSAASASNPVVATGKVADISAVVDTTNGGVAIRVVVPRNSHVWRIGQAVSGVIALASHPKALTVPEAALVPEGDGFRVFVVDARSVAHARPVVVGARAHATAWITSGLDVGDVVVTTGAYGVDDGARVVRVKP